MADKNNRQNSIAPNCITKLKFTQLSRFFRLAARIVPDLDERIVLETRNIAQCQNLNHMFIVEEQFLQYWLALTMSVLLHSIFSER